MASYHLEAQMIGRSAGRSAVAASAYRGGHAILRAETGETHDYRRKRGIVSSEILTPPDAPEWSRDPETLWNAVEAKETRKNSQLCREIKVALPHELTEEQARQLVTTWAREAFVAEGMAVELSIHDPVPEPGRSRNLHAHLMLTTRRFDLAQPDGWAKTKERGWNSEEKLIAWRESWAVAQNRALEHVGSMARVDHRSLEAQAAEARAEGREFDALALDRPPEPRLGVAATAIEKRAARCQGPFYEPVTDRGRDLAQARSLRAALIESVVELYREARRAVAVARRMLPPLPASERRHLRDIMSWDFPDNRNSIPDDGPSGP